LNSNQTVKVLRDGREMELTVKTEPLPNELAGNRRSRANNGEQGKMNSDLGLVVADVTKELTQRLDLPSDAEGVVVTGVTSRGLAARAGLQQGMLITEVNNEPVRTIKDFEKAIADTDLERGVKLLVKVPGVGTRSVIIRDR
jgi:serine protease Do